MLVAVSLQLVMRAALLEQNCLPEEIVFMNNQIFPFFSLQYVLKQKLTTLLLQLIGF